MTTESSALLDPTVFRYTVRTPEARHGAIKDAARRHGMTPGQLAQALFDRLDLTGGDGFVAAAVEDFRRLYGKADTAELAKRAASCGLTVKQLRVFRALAEAAGPTRIVRPSALDISARSMVPAHDLQPAYDRLLEKGFIAIAPSQGRGRTGYAIARMPEV
jgi:hypothetical protein